MKEGTRVLVALGAAIALGMAIGASGSAPLIRAADALAPIGGMWVNAIRMTVIPLVVSLLITGVASSSDMTVLGRLGGRTALVFGLLLAGTAAVVIPLAPSLFALLPHNADAQPPLPAGAIEATSQIAADGQTQTFATWVTSLIPANPIAAAANGAMVPLILFTLLLALAIAHSPPTSRVTLVAVFQALGEAMQGLVHWVILAAPIGVFALILPLAAHAGAGLAGAFGFYIAVYSIANIVIILLLYPVVAVAAGIPMRQFARAALPPQLIAFSSSSSIAALPALIESAERGLRLSGKATSFVLPVAVSTFKIGAPVSWAVGALFIGWFYGIPLGARELGLVAFAAVFLSFATPGVPNGAFILLTPLFQAIGLPPEGIGILIALDTIPDRFATSLNVTGDLAATAIVARRVELDIERER